MFKVSQIINQDTSSLNEYYQILSNENNINEEIKNPKFLITHSNKQMIQKEKKNEIKKSSNGRWSKEEHNKFIEGIIKFGNDWKKIQKYIPSRTNTQARSHAQKFLMKLKNSDYFKNKNIDLSLSWSKTIQLIKNSLSEDDFSFVLKNVSYCNKLRERKKKFIHKKIRVKKKKFQIQIKNNCYNCNNANYNQKEKENVNKNINENIRNNFINNDLKESENERYNLEKDTNFNSDNINNENEYIFSTTSEYSNSLYNDYNNINRFFYFQMKKIPQKNYENNTNDYLINFMNIFNKNSLSYLDFSNDDIDNIYYNISSQKNNLNE